MAKWQIVDDQDAPEDFSGMSDDAKEKLEILRALVPGKTIVVEVETAKQRGYKAALTRVATTQKMAVKVWSNGEKVCVKLAEPAAE